MATDSGKKRLQGLTERADIKTENRYPQPRGARPFVQRAIEQGAGAADQLGNSIRVVEEAFPDVFAEERAHKTGEAFEKHDG